MEVARRIRDAVLDDRYLIGEHALLRMDERGVPEWQIIAGMEDAHVVGERPDAEPNPVAEYRITLPDGNSMKAVWAWIRALQIAKLVTVHYFDR